MPTTIAHATPIAHRVSEASAWPSSVAPLNGCGDERDRTLHDRDRGGQHARRHESRDRRGDDPQREER